LKRILFLCASSDSLSLVAEALLRRIDSRNFEAFSATPAGYRPHPLAVDVMKEIGIDLGSKESADDFGEQRFDFVISLDELSARQPNSIVATETVHWKFENPLTVSDDAQVQRRTFQSVRDQIAQRIRLFVIVHARKERVLVASASARTYSNTML
jgi:protein-tyrosine-phosphatase